MSQVGGKRLTYKELAGKAGPTAAAAVNRNGSLPDGLPTRCCNRHLLWLRLRPYSCLFGLKNGLSQTLKICGSLWAFDVIVLWRGGISGVRVSYRTSPVQNKSNRNMNEPWKSSEANQKSQTADAYGFPPMPTQTDGNKETQYRKASGGRGDFEYETCRQVRATCIFMRRKFKRASFGEVASFATSCVLIVVGVAAAGIYFGQLVQMRKSTNAATNAVALQEDSLHIDQRAWVTVSNVEMANPKSGIGIDVTITNTGKTPAKNFTIKVAGEPVRKGSSPTAEELLQPGHGIIAPNGKFYFVLSAKDSYDALVSNLTVHGRIDYFDIFSDHHWTTFCYYWIPQGGFAPCDSGNDIDVTPPPKIVR